MKRSKPLARRTELRAHSVLKGGGFLKRGTFVPKRPVVTSAERKARKVVRARSGGACEVCGRTEAQQMHHRKKAGREWAPANLLHVCGAGNYSGCHGHIERNPTAAKQQGWWLLPNQDPERTPCWLAGRGYVFLADSGDIQLVEDEAA